MAGRIPGARTNIEAAKQKEEFAWNDSKTGRGMVIMALVNETHWIGISYLWSLNASLFVLAIEFNAEPSSDAFTHRSTSANGIHLSKLLPLYCTFCIVIFLPFATTA